MSHSLSSAGLPKLARFRSEVIQEETSQDRLRKLMATNIEKYNHLLVGKVRDTQLMFSFFIEASIIDVDANAGNALQ